MNIMAKEATCPKGHTYLRNRQIPSPIEGGERCLIREI